MSLAVLRDHYKSLGWWERLRFPTAVKKALERSLPEVLHATVQSMSISDFPGWFSVEVVKAAVWLYQQNLWSASWFEHRQFLSVYSIVHYLQERAALWVLGVDFDQKDMRETFSFLLAFDVETLGYVRRLFVLLHDLDLLSSKNAKEYCDNVILHPNKLDLLLTLQSLSRLTLLRGERRHDNLSAVLGCPDLALLNQNLKHLNPKVSSLQFNFDRLIKEGDRMTITELRTMRLTLPIPIPAASIMPRTPVVSLPESVIPSAFVDDDDDDDDTLFFKMSP